MTATAQWRRWINGWIDKAGGLSGLAFRIPVQVSTVGRWRDGIAFPEADHQEMLAQITGEQLSVIKELVWHAEKERALAKRRPLIPLAPEVAGGAASFRVKKTADGSRLARQTLPAGTRPARRVKRLRRGGLAGLILVGALSLGTPANASQGMLANSASDQASSVDWRRRRAA